MVKNPITDLLIQIIKVYKIFISPLLGINCRYYPSCSDYAIETIKKYGALRGSIKAIYRILRCNPFSKGGYDPVK